MLIAGVQYYLQFKIQADYAHSGRMIPPAHRERSSRLQGFAGNGWIMAARIFLKKEAFRRRAGRVPSVKRQTRRLMRSSA